MFTGEQREESSEQLKEQLMQEMHALEKYVSGEQEIFALENSQHAARGLLADIRHRGGDTKELTEQVNSLLEKAWDKFLEGELASLENWNNNYGIETAFQNARHTIYLAKHNSVKVEKYLGRLDAVRQKYTAKHTASIEGATPEQKEKIMARYNRIQQHINSAYKPSNKVEILKLDTWLKADKADPIVVNGVINLLGKEYDGVKLGPNGDLETANYIMIEYR